MNESMRSWTLSALMFYSNKKYYKTPSDYVPLNLEAILLYGIFLFKFLN